MNYQNENQIDKMTILKGMWWVKGNEQYKFAGILTYAGGYAPTLEIFLKEYEFGKRSVPDNSTIYGDVLGESEKIQAVTLLGCTSNSGLGIRTVGAYLYKQEFLYADCVAIGMLLNDDEIAQVKFPKNIYLACPSLTEYRTAKTIEYFWKDNIPKGRAYKINDLDRIVYYQPEPIVIEIDIGTITLSLGPSSTDKSMSWRYSIQINLDNPRPEAEVNSLIYSQLLSFLSIMTGRREYIKKHSIVIDSNQTRSGSLSLELNYGHIAYAPQESKSAMLQTLLIGREDNMRKFATLFPKWRENFTFVKELAFHYLQMVDQPTETNILEAFRHIENYVLERLLKKNKKGMQGILEKVIYSVADYFQHSKVYAHHFPTNKIEHISIQIANYRHNKMHPKSNKECLLSLGEIHAYLFVVLRSIFLIEMEYTFKDIDTEINHWQLWRHLDGE